MWGPDDRRVSHALASEYADCHLIVMRSGTAAGIDQIFCKFS